MAKPRHGGHLIAQALKNEGVRYLFTLSGGHIAPIYDGCVDLGIEVIDFRHEQAAVHCADGWARVTLEPGIAAVTAGPGFTDGVTGIANAFYANSPILVFSGKNPIFEFEMGSLQEMDQVSIAKNITKWAKTCYDTRRLADYTTAALRQVGRRDSGGALLVAGGGLGGRRAVAVRRGAGGEVERVGGAAALRRGVLPGGGGRAGDVGTGLRREGVRGQSNARALLRR